MNYYNDNDPVACAWLRELIAARLVPDGEVDSRSIADVIAKDVRGYTQVHWFAGIGGWPQALQLAGWPQDRPIWSASCPCQPWSGAGKGLGEEDPRHLWPKLERLVADCRPECLIGEQVASAAGRQWLSRIRVQLENLGYGVGAADICAASRGEKGEGWIVRGDTAGWEPIVIGAPHIRQRLYWVADTGCERDERRGTTSVVSSPAEGAQGEDLDATGRDDTLRKRKRGGHAVADSCPTGRLVLANGTGRNTRQPASETTGHGGSIESAGGWSNFSVVQCLDGKARRVEAGTFPLAARVSGDMELLRGYGNSIVPPLAAEFIAAYMEAVHVVRR